MDPNSIALVAGAAVHLLAPYFKEVTNGVVEAVGNEVAKPAISAALEKSKKIYELIKTKLHGNPEASKALAKLEVAPDDVNAQNAVKAHVEEALANDPGMNQQLGDLLKEVAATKADISFVNNIQGEVQKLVQIGTVIGNVQL